MRYNVLINNVGELSNLATSAEIFGFLFSQYIRFNRLNTTQIKQALESINQGEFHISDCLPEGYVYNFNTNYYIESLSEEYTQQKATLQKLYKKPDYISKKYIEDNLTLEGEMSYLKIYKDTTKLKKNFFSLSKRAVLHKTEKTQYLMNIINVPKNTRLYFTIEVEEKFDRELLKLLKQIKYLKLGAKSSSGFNLYKKVDVKIEKSKQVGGTGIILSQYIPKTVDEINFDKIQSSLKIKSKAVRPILKLADATNKTRYLYNYIEQGNLITVVTPNYGKLLAYDNYTTQKYQPYIYGKGLIYFLKGNDE